MLAAVFGRDAKQKSMRYLFGFLTALATTVLMEIGNQFLHYGSFLVGWTSCCVFFMTVNYFESRSANGS